MYIAIVDDSNTDAMQARELLQKYLAGRVPSNIHIYYEFFSSAEAFLQHFTPGYYDIIILDIYMYELTGMEAARKIVALDENCKIIFLTTSTEHLLAGYTVHAAGYILKPLAENQEQFFKALDYCFSKIKLSQAVLTVHTGTVPVVVPMHELYYLDCQNSRFVKLHLSNHELKTTNTYQDCLDQLQQDKRFLECYHRLLVNMEQIKVMQEDTFLMKNDEAIPISRRKKNEVKQAYLAYLTEH